MLMRLPIHKSGEVVAAFRAEYMPFSEEARAAA
jgi:hypothetical protein